MRRILRAYLWVFLALSMIIPAGGVANAADVIWSAYNDCLKEAGDSTAANVTEWTIHDGDSTRDTGLLKDFETGSDAGMPRVTFTTNGVGTSSGGAAGNPASGTPAYDLFHDDGGNIIVDLAPNHVKYGSSGWWVEIEFTDLDPTKTYTFAGTAMRSSDYPGRISLFTIIDADIYINNSDIPPAHPDWVGTDTTKLQAGDNTITGTGYVVRWEDIVAGSDGSFIVRAEATSDSDSGRAYPFGGFMLQQTGAVGNRPPTVDAGDDQTKWIRSSSVTVQLDGSASDDGIGDPNGYLAMEWVRTGGSGEGAILFTPGNNVSDPNFTVYDFGTYELQFEATDGALATNDRVTITIREGLIGDLFVDNVVDWRDMVSFCEDWLDGPGSEADLVDNDGVNEVDYAVLANNWWIQTYNAMVEISEFMADNEDTIFTIYEPGGEEHSPDWIEIHNMDVNAVDLGGWYLTDNANELNKWQFPYGFTIEGGGYEIVFASGLGDSDDQFRDPYGYYHTNFELRKGGEYLALVAPGSLEAVHEYADYEYDDDQPGYPPQEEDYSYGLLGSLKRYFSTPTPKAENSGAIEGFVADTQFSHNRGFYDSGFQVQLSTETPDAIIRYTTDSSAPSDSHGEIYDPANHIEITTTTCLRAGAFKTGWAPSNIDTQTYIFPDDVLGQATDPSTGAQVTPSGYPSSWGGITGDYQVDPEIVNHANADNRLTASDMQSVPTFSLVLGLDGLFGSNQIYLSGDGVERLCSIEMINPDGSTAFQENGTIQIQGGSSVSRWKSKKLSMRYKFKEFMKNGTPTGGPRKLNYQLYPDAPIDQYDNIIFDGVLNNSWSHGTSSSQRNNCMFIQDQYVGDLHNVMGGHSPRGLFAHIYLNGLYWGMYYVHDRPDHAWAEEMFGGDKEEQHALKHNKVTVNNGNGNSAVGSYNAMLTAGTNAGGNPTDLAAWESLTDKLDVDNFITYILAHWFTGTNDWCSSTSAKNIYYTCRDGSEGRWRFHTWDAEHTMYFGTTGFEVSPHGLHNSLKPNVEYKMRFGDLVHRCFYNNGVMSGLNPYNMYQARMTEIDRAIVGESARWGDAWDSTPRTREQWLDVQAGKLSMLNGRPAYILGRLESTGLYPSVDAPVFGQHGGWSVAAVDITISGGSAIWYTADGNDPRLQGGETNPDAISISSGASIHIGASTHLKARVKSGSTWSALNEAIFGVHPLTYYLRISEIMYHPQNTGNPDDPNEEFIELTNIGGTPINLSLVSFTNGIDFTFGDVELAAGDYVVVVRNRAAFEAQYPAFTGVIAGQYAGSLDNGGERIELEDALGQSILRFSYKDGWRSITDGQGFSLTIIDPADSDPSNWDKQDSWRASAYVGGSPGYDDSGLLPNPGDVVINEVLAHSHDTEADWIELHNTTDSQIDIGGWYLSDSDDVLQKYQFAVDTKIDAHDYLVLYEDANFGDSSSDPGKITGFAFSENGDQAYLSSAEGGFLTGYRAVEDFDASYTGISFGRYYKSSTDSYNFVPMDHNTPGAANAYPKVGPIVISEIMYNPDWPAGGMYANDGYEFIELYNITDEAVKLYRDDKALPWQFSDGIEYVFGDAPDEVTIAANDYIVVVKDVDAFMWLYPSVPAAKIFGPYDGKLSNGGERVEISMPGDTDEFDRQYYIRIDRVAYSDGSHHEDAPGGIDLWPIEADGAGKSLSRTAPKSYGNDPNNWTAQSPTPGAANP